MPNLPAQIGKGVTVLCSEDADMDRRQIAEELMRVLGAVEWIADEALFHAVTALSGSGPGYVLRFIEAMADAGRALGLPEELASRLAVETRSEEHTSELQSLMRTSYAVFCLKKKRQHNNKR